MPIKFRCNYCRQFLGISRAQAGGIVDCPTCGRSIRVPMLDGTVQPLPDPELNMQDAHLARALDELAQLAEIAGQPLNSPGPRFSEVNGDADDENEIPQPIPEPIPIEVPIPPTPIKIDPPIQALESIPDSASVTPGQSVPSGNGPLDASHEQHLLAELASLAPPPAPERPHRELETPAPTRLDARGSRPRRSAVQTSLAVLILFLAGMLTERFARVIESFQPAATPKTQSSEPEASPAGAVTGRIMFKTPEGESQPDRGARLIVFPQERTGQVKLPITGFRPADDQADAKIAAAALSALGGAMTSVDDTGKFRLDLPAGSYRILVLSHFQSRDESAAPDPELLKLLGAYFDKPDDLLGRVQHHFAPLRVKGTGDVWDHAF